MKPWMWVTGGVVVGLGALVGLLMVIGLAGAGVEGVGDDDKDPRWAHCLEDLEAEYGGTFSGSPKTYEERPLDWLGVYYEETVTAIGPVAHSDGSEEREGWASCTWDVQTGAYIPTFEPNFTPE